jgi:hypothetical protein
MILSHSETFVILVNVLPYLLNLLFGMFDEEIRKFDPRKQRNESTKPLKT